MTPSTAELIQCAVAGDTGALSTLLERHGPVVRRRLVSAIPRRWRSVIGEDDVLQQTYVDALRDIGGFQGRNEQSFECWLETLSRRNLLDALRMLEADKRGGNHRRLDLRTPDESYVNLFEVLAGGVTTPSRRATRNEAHDTLKQALSRLPAAYRQVVEMYDIQGKPVDEVAEALDRSSGATYMLRARAHRMLCDIMGTASDYLTDSR